MSKLDIEDNTGKLQVKVSPVSKEPALQKIEEEINIDKDSGLLKTKLNTFHRILTSDDFKDNFIQTFLDNIDIINKFLEKYNNEGITQLIDRNIILRNLLKELKLKKENTFLFKNFLTDKQIVEFDPELYANLKNAILRSVLSTENSIKNVVDIEPVESKKTADGAKSKKKRSKSKKKRSKSKKKRSTVKIYT